MNITTDVSATSITLTWDSLGTGASYHVYRNGAFLAATTLPTYIDSTVTPSQTYTYTVYGFASGSVRVQTPALAPLPLLTGVGRLSGGMPAPSINGVSALVGVVNGSVSLIVASTTAYSFPVTGQDSASAVAWLDSSHALLVGGYPMALSVYDTGGVRVSQTPLGDINSRGAVCLRLASGDVAIAWYEHISTGSWDLTVNVGVRHPDGGIVVTPVVVPNSLLGGNITSSRLVLVQHPVTNNVWLLGKRDSFHSLFAVEFRPDNASVVSVTPGLLNSTRDGNLVPDGEFPFIGAVPVGDGFDIFYQNNQSKAFLSSAGTFPAKGCYLTAAHVQSAAAPVTFSTAEQWAEAFNNIHYARLGTDAAFLYRAVQPDGSTSAYYSVRRTGGVWGIPVLFATTPYQIAGLAGIAQAFYVDASGSMFKGRSFS